MNENVSIFYMTPFFFWILQYFSKEIKICSYTSLDPVKNIFFSLKSLEHEQQRLGTPSSYCKQIEPAGWVVRSKTWLWVIKHRLWGEWLYTWFGHPKFEGESLSKSKPQYGKLRVALFFGFPTRRQTFCIEAVIDNSSTKGGAGQKGRNPRIGSVCLLWLQRKTDPGMRDTPKIRQHSKCLSYPSDHSHMENEIKSHGKIWLL